MGRKAEEPPDSTRGKEPEAPPAQREAKPEETQDPRLSALEPLLARGAWSDILGMLGPKDKVGFLPPTLGLIYAVAEREVGPAESATAANEMAIRCVAGLLGVSATSEIALVLGKRLVRKNPAAWRARPAPPARVSIPIVIVGLLLGAAVGAYLAKAPLALLFR